MKKQLFFIISIFLVFFLVSCAKGKENNASKENSTGKENNVKTNFEVVLRAGGYGIEITNMGKDTIHNLKFTTGGFEAYAPLVRAESSVDISWSEFRDDENYPLSRICPNNKGKIDRILNLECDEGTASWHVQYQR